jgi:hypothetical protein
VLNTCFSLFWLLLLLWNSLFGFLTVSLWWGDSCMVFVQIFHQRDLHLWSHVSYPFLCRVITGVFALFGDLNLIGCIFACIPWVVLSVVNELSFWKNSVYCWYFCCNHPWDYLLFMIPAW